MSKSSTTRQARLRILSLAVCLAMTLGVMAQITVRGHVTDSVGNPVYGASVHPDGTEMFISTDSNGDFTLGGVQQGANISVTYNNVTTNVLADTVVQVRMNAPAPVTVQAPTAQPATQPAAEEQPVVKELSVWDLTMAGGWLMIPLALLAIISIYIFFERLFVISRASHTDADTFMEKIKNLIHRGEVDKALTLCKETNTPYARMIEKGVSRIGRPMNDVLVAIENVGNMEIARLEKGFNWLATTAAGAPMIGFLGTVTGMVQAFFQLASAGNNSNVTILASGIYQALVTTVAGLIVGILAMFAYNYLTSRVNKVMNKLEGKTMEFMDLLNEPAK